MTFNKASRDLDIRGRIDLTDGSAIELTSDNVFSYSINENNASSGFPLGSTSAGNYSLTINNVGKHLDGTLFDGAKVTVEVGLKGDDGQYAYSPFGQWYASNLSAPEQSVNATVTGYDALGMKFGAVFEDSADGYPCTLKDLFEDVCGLAGVSYRTSLFVNSDKPVSEMPKWPDGVTLREVLGYIAACAGGFARIARDGLLEIISFGRTITHSLTPDNYFTFTPKDGVAFAFNALQVKFPESESYTRFAVDDTAEDNATNTIQIDGNPLITEEMAWVIVAALDGFGAIGSSTRWQGDPAVRCGDKVVVTDLKGRQWTSIINSQQIRFSGGLVFDSICNIPTLSKNNSPAYRNASSPINPDGTINANRVAGLTKVVENSKAFAETTKRIEEAEEKLANAEKDLADSKQSVGELAQTVNTLTGEVSQKVSQTDYNVLADRVTSNETSISQNAEKIESKASIESVEILRGTVTGLETTVTQQAAQIELKAEREDVDTLNDKVTDNEAAIRLNAEAITSRVEQEVAQLNSVIAGKADSVAVEQIATEFEQTASTLEARVTANEGGIEKLQTGVTVDAEGVTIRQPNQTDNTMVLRAGSMTINAPGREALVISQEESYMPNLRVSQFVMGNLVTTVSGSGADCRVVSQYVQ